VRLSRPLQSLLVALAAIAVTACASTGTVGGNVPRPFPGAASPPTAIPTPPDSPATSAPEPAPLTPLPELIVTALSFRGTPYRYGGSDPSGFDCSGFVQWVYNAHGVRLPREVRDQYRVGDDVDLDEVEPGDLIFFETEKKGASHVGLAIGDGQFVHAPSSKGVVRVERYSSSYWGPRLVGVRRITTKRTETD
jgi:cell wall-associated NlpC family hydrolase